MGSLFECRYLRIYGNGNTVDTANHLYELEIASQSFNTVIDGSGILTNSITADKLKVNSLSAVSATIGVLRTSTEGARTEISDNLIQVFDSAGNVRIKLGVF